MLTPSPDAPRTSVSPILLELLTTDERPLSNVTELFAGIFKGSIRKQSIEKLRFLREDVAIVDVKMELKGYTRLSPGIQSGSDGVHRTSLQLVLAKEQDGWRIAAFHNVTIVPSTARP
jgi:hypothetical protein